MAEIIHHALMLNFHQPSGNIHDLLLNKEWEAKEILWALDRMPRSLWGYEDVARVHCSFSGTLLEALSNPAFQGRVYGIVKCGDLLWHLQNMSLFEILGTGYYHPVFPLIPREDWEEQGRRWLGLGRHLFGRSEGKAGFGGFWPPEMGFCMEMIPLLCRLGYRYVIVDSAHVEPIGPMRWEELRYMPHYATFEGHQIIVIVRDRELSDAQISGMDWGWFAKEVNDRTANCTFAPLVTTCSDGENGGWFRNTSPKGNFWQYFYREYLNRIRALECNIRPIFITDYLNRYGVHGQVVVKRGAWNTGRHSGAGFIQWAGSQAQKDGLARIAAVSTDYHAAKQRRRDLSPAGNRVRAFLDEAGWRLLRAETSCNFYWGDAWIPRCHSDLDAATRLLDEMKKAE